MHCFEQAVIAPWLQHSLQEDWSLFVCRERGLFNAKRLGAPDSGEFPYSAWRGSQTLNAFCAPSPI